jgi:tRNA modification GTPase
MDAKNAQRATICAIATPPGVGGLAVIRCSGSDALRITDCGFRGTSPIRDTKGHTIRYGWWYTTDDRIVDSVTVSVFRAPHSYTGEDVVEIGCHGGPFVARQILDDCIRNGAIVAGPGEFTQRAFLNGKLDMTQVEAVSDLIHAQSELGAQAAARQLHGEFVVQLGEIRTNLLRVASLLELELDFTEEDVEFVDRSDLCRSLHQVADYCENLSRTAKGSEILRSGYHIAIVGYPNAGKSSIFNALVGKNRAIVSDVEGTTRDYIIEQVLIDGTIIHLADTAGIRATSDTVELQGIHLTQQLINQSNGVILVNDVLRGIDFSDGLYQELCKVFDKRNILIVHNKTDRLTDSPEKIPNGTFSTVFASSTNPQDMKEIERWISSRVIEETSLVRDVLVNQRHAVQLEVIAKCCHEAIRVLSDGHSPDLAATDIRLAVQALGELTGETWNPDILENVFSSFCIGK